MNYTICELEAFSVIGQEVELTNFQRKNIEISTQFWRKFNTNLKRAYISQSGNWFKYAFMERRDGSLFYYCAVPQKAVVPKDFVLKEIKKQKYLVVDHIGAMDKIYDTYRIIYQEILPNVNYVPYKDKFLHFERYNDRFHWNKENSMIGIWVPIKSL